MPQNDPGFWELLAAGIAACAASISAWSWKHTHGLISGKAELSQMSSLISRFERACIEQREDNQRIFDQIKDISGAFSMQSQHVIEELGKRPTREECRNIWHKTP